MSVPDFAFDARLLTTGVCIQDFVEFDEYERSCRSIQTPLFQSVKLFNTPFYPMGFFSNRQSKHVETVKSP